MNVSKEQFTAEIMRRQQERAEARKAAEEAEHDYELEDSQLPYSGGFYDYLNNRKYRGKFRTGKLYEC